jgi:hypothetical protein
MEGLEGFSQSVGRTGRGKALNAALDWPAQRRFQAGFAFSTGAKCLKNNEKAKKFRRSAGKSL